MSDKYISKYSNNKFVSAAQYITEIICEHKAKKDKKSPEQNTGPPMTKLSNLYHRH